MRYLLLFFLLPILSYGQSKKVSIDIEDYDRLIVVDSYNNNYQRFLGVIYEIDLNSKPKFIYQQKKYYDSGITDQRLDSIFRHYDSIEFKFTKPFIPNDKKIKEGEIKDSIINELINKINNPVGPKSIDKVFDWYKIDSLWLIEKKDSLKQLCLLKQKKTDKKEEFFINYVLSNYHQFKKMGLNKIFQSTTSHYPEVYISFESETDSVVLYNEGQYSFLLPWRIDTTYWNFDPDISILIGQLLPNQEFSINKKYLSPTKEDFVDDILDQIIRKSYFVSKKRIKNIKKQK